MAKHIIITHLILLNLLRIIIKLFRLFPKLFFSIEFLNLIEFAFRPKSIPFVVQKVFGLIFFVIFYVWNHVIYLGQAVLFVCHHHYLNLFLQLGLLFTHVYN